MTLLTYIVDGRRAKLVKSLDGEQWVCECRAYRTRASELGPRRKHVIFLTDSNTTHGSFGTVVVESHQLQPIPRKEVAGSL